MRAIRLSASCLCSSWPRAAATMTTTAGGRSTATGAPAATIATTSTIVPDTITAMVAAPEDLDFDATVWDAGDGRIDIIVRVTEAGPTEQRPERAPDRPRDGRPPAREPKTVWGFLRDSISAAPSGIESASRGQRPRSSASCRRGPPGVRARRSAGPLPGERRFSRRPGPPRRSAPPSRSASPRAEELLAEERPSASRSRILRPDDTTAAAPFPSREEASSIRRSGGGESSFHAAHRRCRRGARARSVFVEETENRSSVRRRGATGVPAAGGPGVRRARHRGFGSAEKNRRAERRGIGPERVVVPGGVDRRGGSR